MHKIFNLLIALFISSKCILPSVVVCGSSVTSIVVPSVPPVVSVLSAIEFVVLFS